MSFVAEIRKSDAVTQFLKRPRFLLGKLILVAGKTLLAGETGKTFYR